MADEQLQAVPAPVYTDVPEGAPQFSAFYEAAPELATLDVGSPLVEPLETFNARLAEIARTPGPDPEIEFTVTPSALPQWVSHRNWQTALSPSQGGRGSCWAFAGIAALEAAYARTGVRVDLSEHYLFHISKAHELHRVGPGIHSLVGFQGSADIVQNMTYWAVPLSAHVPYIDQPALQTLANSIPGTGNALSGAGGGTREQADWFEFDLRNIPLMGLWFAQYRVRSFGKATNFNNDTIKQVLANGYDVVVNVFDKVNNGGHVLVIYGYDDRIQRFEIKNSQRLPGFEQMSYTNDSQFNILYGSMFYITAVEPVATQWAAMWVGRWETDHDGWRGSLVIRRFADVLSGNLLPGPNSRISLGTWYGEDGRALDVVGHFVDGGRGLHCAIGGQPFELYLHTRDPYRAGGRTWWNNTPFGVVMSRGTAVGAGSGFDRSESIGIWDTVHDGWRGEMRLGASPVYIQAADAVARSTWIDPGSTPHRVDAYVNFGSTNPNQPFQLLVNTREDGLLGGVTSWGGKDWPVEGRMAQHIYTIQSNGILRWYRHTGRAKLNAEWDPPKEVGNGWAGFLDVFGGGDGVIYAIRPDGVLLWYYHDGRNQGTFDWQGPKQVGTGWTTFTRVFAGDGGVVYGIKPDGRMLWYRHLGRRDGSPRWQGPFEVGTGWNSFTAITGSPDGCIYGKLPDGRLFWYRHYGHDQGYPIWYGPTLVGTGWQGYDNIWAVGNGYFYGRTAAGGDLIMWRHHDFLTGGQNWTGHTKVGNGWGGAMKDVFST